MWVWICILRSRVNILYKRRAVVRRYDWLLSGMSTNTSTGLLFLSSKITGLTFLSSTSTSTELVKVADGGW